MRRRWSRVLLAISARSCVARLRRKRFANIVTLGSNCELAFRFYVRWGFVDSSLFSWATVSDLNRLTYALRHLDDICEGPMTLNPVRMWVCENTGVKIHGRLKYVPGEAPPDAAAQEADRADLLGRVRHLREKMRRYAADEASTLFIYSIPTADVEAPGLGDRIDEVENAIRELGARNWKLLLVVERHVAHLVPRGPDRHVRTVRRFNPTNDVTNSQIGDSVGWYALFTEFAPAKILKKSKKFKFER